MIFDMRDKVLFSILLMMLSVVGLSAQNVVEAPASEEEAMEEIVNTGEETLLDSTLLGFDVFSAMPEGVSVVQSPAVRKAFGRWVESNASSIYSGFRIRIYLDSRRGAREASLSAIKRFEQMFPYIKAYRSYDAPNFKVTVGNFRTRIEAEVLLRELKDAFPDAFVVRDKFKYPSVGTPDMRTLPEEEVVVTTSETNGGTV